MSEVESVSDGENDFEIQDGGQQQDFTENQAEEANNTNENEENENDESKKVVKPKRVVKNPQPKLNEQTLKGPRGLVAIESYFERVKFKGRGHEEQDLNVLLKTYEYWCHRLFPKFPFDNCIERLEKLGTKRATQTHIKRIRMDLNFDQPENTSLREDEEINDTGGFVDTYIDQFDQLTSNTEQVPPTSNTEQVLEITEEQMERIRQNMEKAKRLREEKLRKTREGTRSSLEGHHQIYTEDLENHQMDTTNHQLLNSTNGSAVENNQNGTSEDTEHAQVDIQQTESYEFKSLNIESSDKKVNNYDIQEFDQNESDNTNDGKDNEDDIDNILDLINTKNSSESNKSPDNLKQLDRDKSFTFNCENSQTDVVTSNEHDLQENLKTVTCISDERKTQENLGFVKDSCFIETQTATEEST